MDHGISTRCWGWRRPTQPVSEPGLFLPSRRTRTASEFALRATNTVRQRAEEDAAAGSISLFCAGVNRLIGSNYLYTQGKLPTPSLLDVLGPYPWYLLSMEGLGILLCLLLYLPFALQDWGTKRKDPPPAPP